MFACGVYKGKRFAFAKGALFRHNHFLLPAYIFKLFEKGDSDVRHLVSYEEGEEREGDELLAEDGSFDDEGLADDLEGGGGDEIFGFGEKISHYGNYNIMTSRFNYLVL